jgi:hypothetical protein
VLPRVLAVEDDGDERILDAGVIADPGKPPHEVVDAGVRVPVVVEAEEIGEPVVPEDDRDLRGAVPRAPRSIEERPVEHVPVAVAPERAAERVREDLLVRGHVPDAVPGEDRDDLLRDGPLRRPHTPWRPAEEPLMERDRALHLFDGVIPERARFEPEFPLEPGEPLVRGPEVAEERQDGVVVGARRDLDLARLLEAPVHGEHAPHDLARLREDRLLLLLREPAALLAQAQEHGVLVEDGPMEPGHGREKL